MRSLNKVMLIGHLGSDPELRTTPAGQSVAKFNLATSESWGGRDGGPRQERTEWHKIVLWGRLGEIANEYLRKGRQVYIEGRLQTREWQDQQGQKRWSTEIVAANMVMLGGRGGEGAEMSPRAPGGSAPGPGGPPQRGDSFPSGEGEPAGAGGDFFDDDSDLPF